MSDFEKFNTLNDLLIDVQHRQTCFNDGKFTGNCLSDCRYMACTDMGDSFCMIDAILDETYREFRLWETE